MFDPAPDENNPNLPLCDPLLPTTPGIGPLVSPSTLGLPDVAPPGIAHGGVLAAQSHAQQLRHQVAGSPLIQSHQSYTAAYNAAYSGVGLPRPQWNYPMMFAMQQSVRLIQIPHGMQIPQGMQIRQGMPYPVGVPAGYFPMQHITQSSETHSVSALPSSGTLVEATVLSLLLLCGVINSMCQLHLLIKTLSALSIVTNLTIRMNKMIIRT